MKVLWVSRHAPTKMQLKELSEIFGGDVEVVTFSTFVENGRMLVEKMRQEGCDEIVCVLPLHIISQLTVCGVRPIRAVMLNEKGKLVHSHFERIISIDIKSVVLNKENAYDY